MDVKNLKLLFPFIKFCFTNTSRLLKNLYNFTRNMQKENYTIKKYNLKQGLQSIDIMNFIQDKSHSVSNFTYLNGSSHITDIILLKSLASRFESCDYLEMGSWRGESIVNVAEVANKCISVSLSEQEMRDRNYNMSQVEVRNLFSKNIKNITNIEHDTLTFDFSPFYNSFDLVFIDADHQYNAILSDTINAFKLLKNENSIIVWHDYAIGFEKVNWQVLAGILDGCPSKEHRKNIYHVSNTLCAIYINDEVKTSYPEPHVPTKTFSVSIIAKKIVS